MTRQDVIAKIADKTGLTKKDSEKAASAFLEVIQEALVAKDKVQFVGFGTFETRERAARTGKNPATGAALQIPASTVPAFKAGKALKDAVK